MAASLEGARREITGLLTDPPPGAFLADGAVRALGRVVGHDGYCLFGVDPTDRTAFSHVLPPRPDGPDRGAAANETVERDANRYVDLRARPPGRRAVPGRHPSEHRLHDILPGDGYPC